jgi:hypothetical protein
MINFLLNRLKEPSTWRGLILLATALGLHIKPELSEAIIVLGLALAGGLGTVTPDRVQQPEPVSPEIVSIESKDGNRTYNPLDS